MEKIKFETKQEFLEYCRNEEIYNIPRKYGSQYCTFDDGIDRKNYFENGYYLDEEPKQYPCILVWNENESIISGIFIYPEDFG